MLNEIIRFVQEYPKLFIFIIVEIVYIVVFFVDILKIKKQPSKRKMIAWVLQTIVLILSIILLVIFIFNRDLII